MSPLFMMVFNTVLGLSCHVLERVSATLILVYIQVSVNLSQMILNIIPMESFDDYPTRHKVKTKIIEVKTSFSVCPTLCNFTVKKVFKFERRKVIVGQLNTLSIITSY